MKLGYWATCLAFLSVFVMSVANAQGDTVVLQKNSNTYRPIGVSLAGQPDIFRCKTQDSFVNYGCVNTLPSPFDASVFDYGIGGYTESRRPPKSAG